MFHDVMAEATPIAPPSPPEISLQRITTMSKGFEEGLMLALDGNRPVGVLFLSTFRDLEVAAMTGGVRPDAQRRGVGRVLLQRGLNSSSQGMQTHVRELVSLRSARCSVLGA